MRVLTLVALLSLSGPAVAQMGNHTPCSDPAPFEYLQSLVEKHRGDNGEPDARYLLALRHFVCEQLAAGNLEQAEATVLFDHEKDRVVKKWFSISPRQAY